MKLNAWQSVSLWHSCRDAKESLLGAGSLETYPVSVLGRGSKLIGGTVTVEVPLSLVTDLLVGGFFPECKLNDKPKRGRQSGFQEIGLPFESDVAITRHLAAFLATQSRSTGEAAAPTHVLFNGGVFKADALRNRFLNVVGAWAKSAKADPARELAGADLDLAVARGAAYYGLVKRGKGVRIRGGTARSYYVGIEASMPAVPGMEPPLKAVCVAPAGMEEGTEADITGATAGTEEFGLMVGEKVEFRFLSSTARKDDKVGTVIEDAGGEPHLQETAPLDVELEPRGAAKPGQLVPVRLKARVTEIGTLEVWCVARDGEKWRLEFDFRAQERAA